MHNRLLGGVWVLLLSLALASAQGADSQKSSGFFNKLFGIAKQVAAPETNSVNLSELSTDQISSGLKAAMEKGLLAAVNTLGRTNGFLTNAAVRIPVPGQLKTIETALRRLHQDALVDEFETSLNRAAEKAVPAGAEVLLHSLKQMSIQDAANLLTSKSPTAITDYFRRTSSDELAQKFLPIVSDATSQTGVTSIYKQLLAKASFGKFNFLPRTSLDVDQYVTDKSLEGLFTEIGDEEKRIRENPQARTTELLQKVFGVLGK